MRHAIAICLLLAACGRPAPDTTTGNVRGSAGAVERANVATPAAAAPSPTPSSRDLAGRWTGVEGMYLDVTPTGGGAYTLTMQYDLDHKGVFQGRAVGDGIRFERDGKALTLAPSDGAATGLKYLDGKRDCLTVAPGEGYCRN